MKDELFAFPSIHDNHFQEGMTLRDYFAAKAMQGIQAGWNYEQECGSVFKPDSVAKRAYVMADAMLEARLK